MISVVLQTLEDEEALVGTLASLVSGAADGAVREVIVGDGSTSPGIPVIAEGVGCVYIKGPQRREQRLAIGAEAAKGPWLFFLAPGVEPDEGWYRDARQFIERAERKGVATDRAAIFQIAHDDERRSFSRNLFGPHPGSYGLLIHRSFYKSLGGFRHLPAVEYVDLMRRIGRARLTRLRANLFVTERAVANAELGSGLRGAIASALLMLRVPARLVARLYA
jgi:Glycosyl transferase family 2